MQTKKKTLLIGAAGLTLVALFIFIAATSGRSQADATQGSMTPVAVEVTPVTSTGIVESVSAVGTITAMRDVVVSSETAGRITHVNVKVGDAVRQGQPLVVVDDELKAIAIDQARAQLLAAETNFNKTQKDFARAEKLFASGDIADIELEGNRLALRSSEAQYKSAQVALRLAQRQYDDTRVKAPIAGVVASKRVEVGEMVGPGKEVANIVDVSSLKVKVSIPEEEIGKVRLNEAVTMTVDPLPGTTFGGSVYTIGSKSESPTGHSYPVEVIVRKGDLKMLKVGMFARVEIKAGSAANALTISKESLVNEDTKPAVFVAENNVARLRPVILGLRAGDRYQVLEGLKVGDTVISFGQKSLKDGSPVQYK